MNFSGQKCDICGRVKGETNGWWLHDKNIDMFILRPWDDDRSMSNVFEHICSDNCAAKALSQYMSKSC